MNEYDYYIISQSCFLISIFFILIVNFLLLVFQSYKIPNIVFMFVMFFCFFGLGYYYRNKKKQLESETNRELRELLNDIKNKEI